MSSVEDNVDIQREMSALLDSGLRFSIRLDGHHVVVQLGDYLRSHAQVEMTGTLEDAVAWLLEQRDALLAGTASGVNGSASAAGYHAGSRRFGLTSSSTHVHG